MAFENIKNSSLISSDENTEIKVLIKQISEKFSVPVNELVVKLKPYLDFCKVWINPKLFSDDWTTGKLFIMLLDKMWQDKNYFDAYETFDTNFGEFQLANNTKYILHQKQLLDKINSVTIVSTDELMLFLRKELTDGDLKLERFARSKTYVYYAIDKFVEKKQKAIDKKTRKLNDEKFVIDVDVVLPLSTVFENIGKTGDWYRKRIEHIKNRENLSDYEIEKNISILYYYCLVYAKLTFDSFPLKYFDYYLYDFASMKDNEKRINELKTLIDFIDYAKHQSEQNKINVSKYYSEMSKRMFADNVRNYVDSLAILDVVGHINKKYSKDNATLIKNQVATLTETSTNSIIKIQGKPHFTFNEIIPFYRDYFNFICEFLNLNNIELTLNFKNTGSAGGYVKNWEFQEGKYIFHINNTDKHNIFDILEFIPHELVHVEQYHSKRLVDARNGVSTFEGVNYKRAEHNFRNMRGYLMYIAQPWEREAHLKSFEIVNQYFTSERFKNILSNLDVELSNKINIGIERITNKVNRKKNEYFS